MKSYLKSVVVLVINIFVSIIYIALIFLLINKFCGVSNVIDTIAKFVKNKNLAIALLTFGFVCPLGFIIKFIDRKIS